MTKKVIEECIKRLQWLKFNIVGDESPKPHTFEFASQLYLDNAISILEEVEKVLK